MGSQFVDLNADGHLDYLSATFDGSPHISYGSDEGFAEPVRLKDANGERILISSFWNYEDEEHQDTGRSMADGKARDERCISALGFDWDADGDYDLLLGSYEEGHLYRQMNQGTKAKPAFTGQNIPVMAGGKPFSLPPHMTTPKLVDWDADGDLDIVAGTFKSEDETLGGGVYLSLNEGQSGAPVFGAIQTLIAPVPAEGTEPLRPDTGLYPDPVDFDGDGDLDLIVGGYSAWTPPGRELTAEEKSRAAYLTKQIADVEQKQQLIWDTIAQEVIKEGEEDEEAVDAIYKKYRKEIDDLWDQSSAAKKERKALIPVPERSSFVWFYERLSPPPSN